MGLSLSDGRVCSPGAWAINPESSKASTAPTVSCCCPAISVWPAVPCLMAVRNSPIVYLGSRPFFMVSKQPLPSVIPGLKMGLVYKTSPASSGRRCGEGSHFWHAYLLTLKSRPMDNVRDTDTKTWLEIPVLCLCGSVLRCIRSVYKLSHEVLFIVLQDWSWMEGHAISIVYVQLWLAF